MSSEYSKLCRTTSYSSVSILLKLEAPERSNHVVESNAFRLKATGMKKNKKAFSRKNRTGVSCACYHGRM